MVYHKNAVVNWLHAVPFWPFITVMNTAEINDATVAPPMWGRHFVKLRFTKVTPIAIPDIINGTAWLNFDMPNNSSNLSSAILIQSIKGVSVVSAVCCATVMLSWICYV